MSLPTLEQYNEAAQNPDAFFDPEIAHGKFRKRFNIPLAAWGGFALTYTVETASGKFAVRCFHREIANRSSRYQAITSKLQSLHSSYFVNFSYQENGIRVNGQPYPIVKMAWAKGETLGEFIANNYNNKKALAALKASLLQLAAFLEQNHMAHGDIQGDNLMVADDGKSVQLIDYDGLYLPELAGYKAEESGHRNFQHPLRASISPWDDRLDRFSFILLLLVLDALMLDAKLWEDTRSSSDKFLLGANDFAAPATSETFARLYTYPALKPVLDKFVSVCNGDYEDIPGVSEFLSADYVFANPQPTQKTALRYLAPYPVLNGKDYAACLAHVGEMVELVGEITEVKAGKTYRGAPYYFLNFSDWRGNSVKITVWSDYLKKAKKFDFAALQGKVISVRGLLQPPYEHTTMRNQTYSSISIFLDRALEIIDEKEANYRLNYEKNPLPLPANQKARKTSRKKADQAKSEAAISGSEQASSSASKSTNAKSKSNREIFAEIRKLSQQDASRASSQPVMLDVACPVCGCLASIKPGEAVRVKCQACQSQFEYCHSLKKRRIIAKKSNSLSSSNTSASSNASKTSNAVKTPTVTPEQMVNAIFNSIPPNHPLHPDYANHAAKPPKGKFFQRLKDWGFKLFNFMASITVILFIMYSCVKH